MQIAFLNSPDGINIQAAECCAAEQRRKMFCEHGAVLFIDTGERAQTNPPLSLHVSDEMAVAVMGEFLNREDLATILPVPNASSAAELVVHGLRLQGDSFFSSINGLYCCIVYNRRSRTVAAVVDCTGGFYRLFYATAGSRIAIASSPAEILRLPWVERAVDTGAVCELFATGYVLPPRSMFHSVHKLAPGNMLRIDEQGRTCDQALMRIRPASGSSSPEQLEDALRRSMQRIGSMPGRCACLLSGGIDSGVSAALAASLGWDVTAFSGAFSGSELDESPYARMIADHLGCKQHIVELGDADSLESLPHIVWHLAEPTLDFSVVPTFRLLKEVAGAFDAMVSGDGPDHLFGRYYPLQIKRRIGHFIKPLVPALGLLRVAPLQKLLRACSVPLPDAYRDLFMLPAWGLDSKEELGKLITSPQLYSLGASGYPSGYDGRQSGWRWEAMIDELTYVDFYTDGSLGVFNKVGTMAQAAGIVPREPYLDAEVRNCILGLPINHKLRGSIINFLRNRAMVKHVLRKDIAPRYLPQKVLTKRKGGFIPPMKNWFAHRLQGKTAASLLSKEVVQSGLFKVEYLDTMIRQHITGQQDWSRVLFLVICYDLWHRQYIVDSSLAPPSWSLSELGGV